MSRRGWLVPLALGLGLAFLYLPILSMAIFSFNASKLVTVWDGAHSPTLHWYAELLQNGQILGAAALSLRIAALAATGAAVLGTVAGLVLARFGPFRGRTLLAGMTTAPLVMPEVITGLAMLLLFLALERAIGWPRGRGVVTITLAHVTFALSYVAVIVQSRLTGFDDSLEEAAMDLGARPLRVFLRITLPLVMPAVLSGWLLAFTLSWDDYVISQFVSGPGSSTLPIVIFSKVRLGVSPDVNALATMMLVLVGALLAASTLWRRAAQRRREADARLAAEAAKAAERRST
jgi:putrescine transport system permease protein